MAFKNPKQKPLLLSVLKDIDRDSDNFDQISIIPKNNNANSNLLRKLTILLKRTYSEISATKQFRSILISSQRPKHNDIEGNLIITDSFPLLHKRYKVMEIIGIGTFSQILKVFDIFSQNLLGNFTVCPKYH
jgi:ABC-type phosphate/phosphonate transport system ATPase subunit